MSTSAEYLHVLEVARNLSGQVYASDVKSFQITRDDLLNSLENSRKLSLGVKRHFFGEMANYEAALLIDLGDAGKKPINAGQGAVPDPTRIRPIEVTTWAAMYAEALCKVAEAQNLAVRLGDCILELDSNITVGDSALGDKVPMDVKPVSISHILNAAISARYKGIESMYKPVYYME